jgi:hypothetical protein
LKSIKIKKIKLKTFISNKFTFVATKSTIKMINTGLTIIIAVKIILMSLTHVKNKNKKRIFKI